MAKVNENYEAVVIFSMKQSEEEIKALIEKFSALIEKNGTLEGVEEWGKRRLAYEINDRTEGYYVLVSFKAEPDFPKELDRQYKITDGILRTIIIKKDEE